VVSADKGMAGVAAPQPVSEAGACVAAHWS
jgi:hypothetical protein